jgi:plasmid stabilization system protein ParE
VKQREFVLLPDAEEDLVEAWQLVARRDGADRADSVYGRIEAFCRSLGEFADIGTRQDERRQGLRSVGVPGLKTAVVLFVVTAERVTIVRIGYLGRNVWAEFE